MTRTGQHLAVVGILVAGLTVALSGVIGVPRPGPGPLEADAAGALASLDEVEPALTALLESVRRDAAGRDGAAREAFERALARLAEVRARVERIPAAASRREAGQLLEVVRALVPRIHLLAVEMRDGAGLPDPVTIGRLALLERLTGKAREALDQLREAGALQGAAGGTEKLAKRGARAADSVVPEGIAVLLLTVACAIATALISARRCPSR